MATLLHILAHPAPSRSHTMRIAEAFLASYRESYPQDEVVELDLYQAGVPYLTAATLSAVGKQDNPAAMTSEEREAWEMILGRIGQFAKADKYLVTSPMWNFNIPAILKAYIDQIVQAGHTFRYTEIGTPIGLMTGKRMAIISVRGGIYSQPPMSEIEMSVRYLRSIFGFLGIEIATEIVAEGLALVSPAQQDGILRTAFAQAREAARTF